MPIYEYRCSDCGFQKEFLQKLSDAPMTTCPECGKESLNKMLSAAGFQLKGNGWYATDFKGGKSAGDKKSASDAKSGGDSGKSESAASAPSSGSGACSACST